MDNVSMSPDPTRVKFSNLEKVLYPSLGITKYQVIEYYLKMAPWMLDFLLDRAITMYRFPDGINKEGFYEKDAPKGTPFWVKTFRRYSETANRDIEYVVCNDVVTLAWLANLAALEINIPLSRIDNYEKPDIVLFDVDPEPPADIEDATHAALLLKEKLDLYGLKAYVKTSGKKGLHVVVPTVSIHTFRQTRAFVHQIGKLLAKESELIVSEFSQSRVRGKVFIDYMQNIRFKTMICPYSLRAEQNATVSTPLEWQELEKGVKPQEFNIFSVLKRESHPWKDLFQHKQTLDVDFAFEKRGKSSYLQDNYKAIGNLESESRVDVPLLQPNLPVALKEYTEKRDLTKTGEPMGSGSSDVGSIFVVHEHHARRLHYDFRMAKEGVLKSWAVPKGIPEEAGTRRLAVQTEDHPLEYSVFEGTIPKGQYGAGTVKIWDKGYYEVKIWTEDKIEFLLRGGKLLGMYVLIRLKKPVSKPQKQNAWLLIKKKV
jgi:DNA ligase D-like protein (predicted polymerase)/DNA ligase D-like protein (predicted 3'-phosphoesterase)